MSFLVVAAVATAGLAVGSATYKGASAMGNKADVEAAQEASGNIKQEQLGLLGQQKGLALKAAQGQFTAGQQGIGMGTQMGMRDIQSGGNVAMSKSGLATSGVIESKVKTQTGDLMAKYKSDMTKLFETRDLSRADADLSYRKGEMSADESYQNTLTGLESTPTGFWEGALG
jgi:hypothetical protein